MKIILFVCSGNYCRSPLAEGLAKKPTLALRYTRLLLTEYLRRQMQEMPDQRNRYKFARRREGGSRHACQFS